MPRVFADEILNSPDERISTRATLPPLDIDPRGRLGGGRGGKTGIERVSERVQSSAAETYLTRAELPGRLSDVMEKPRLARGSRGKGFPMGPAQSAGDRDSRRADRAPIRISRDRASGLGYFRSP